MTKYDNFVSTKVTPVGLTGVTFQIPAATKAKVDRIADSLNRSSSEVYRELIETGLPDLEATVREYLASVAKVDK